MPATTLAEAISQYGRDAYLLTVGKGGPHTSSVSAVLRGNVINCAIGTSAAANISGEPNVSIFWPPKEEGGYAMIVNGVATEKRQEDGVIVAEIKLTKSVLHRPGPKPDDSDGPCTSDCKRLTRSA